MYDRDVTATRDGARSERGLCLCRIIRGHLQTTFDGRAPVRTGWVGRFRPSGSGPRPHCAVRAAGRAAANQPLRECGFRTPHPSRSGGRRAAAVCKCLRCERSGRGHRDSRICFVFNREAFQKSTTAHRMHSENNQTVAAFKKQGTEICTCLRCMYRPPVMMITEVVFKHPPGIRTLSALHSAHLSSDNFGA